MKKILIYTMEDKKMCFMHALMNAEQLLESGNEVNIIIEGGSVTLVKEFEKEHNKLYFSLKERGVILGICLACSKMLNVYEENQNSGLKFLDNMNGHAGMAKYVNEGYEVIVF